LEPLGYEYEIQGYWLLNPVTKKQSKIGRELDIFRKSTFYDFTVEKSREKSAVGIGISRVDMGLKGESSRMESSYFRLSELFFSTLLIAFRRCVHD
jgi:hypothetical protein